MSADRTVQEGVQPQGEVEVVAYSITTTPWGTNPTGVVVTVYDDEGNDVTSTVAPGAPAVLGDVITLQAIRSLVRDTTYTVHVKFTVDSGNVLSALLPIAGEQ